MEFKPLSKFDITVQSHIGKFFALKMNDGRINIATFWRSGHLYGWNGIVTTQYGSKITQIPTLYVKEVAEIDLNSISATISAQEQSKTPTAPEKQTHLDDFEEFDYKPFEQVSDYEDFYRIFSELVFEAKEKLVNDFALFKIGDVVVDEKGNFGTVVDVVAKEEITYQVQRVKPDFTAYKGGNGIDFYVESSISKVELPETIEKVKNAK